jgi:hypothetical protein
MNSDVRLLNFISFVLYNLVHNILLELLHCEYFISSVPRATLGTQNSHLGKLNAERHISVYDMNNKKKHTSSTNKAVISFLKATFQFIHPKRPIIFSNGISVRTT